VPRPWRRNWTRPDVHYGRAEAIQANRAKVLNATYATHPERFVRKAPHRHRSSKRRRSTNKFKDYIFPLVFLKRLSAVFDDEMAKLTSALATNAGYVKSETQTSLARTQTKAHRAVRRGRGHRQGRYWPS
jgi:hypothetical protein